MSSNILKSILALLFVGKVYSDCLPTIPLILDDIHDGDQKMIKSIEWDTFVIRSYPNVSEWEVEGKFNINCVAMVDFNVSGKTDYPPVPLKMSMYVMQDVAIPSVVKLGFEFTDPSETLAARTHPLNLWMSSALYSSQLTDKHQPLLRKDKLKSETCIYTPHGKPVVFNDILESDMKNITVEDENLTIEPYSSDEDWLIESTFEEGCVSLINFYVPGYPNPPKPETMSVWGMAAISGENKDGMVFVEPTTGIGLGRPLNAWVPENEERDNQ